MNIFADNIWKALDCYGWTIRNLSAASGVHPAHLSRILHGHQSISLKTATAIADALNVSLSDMFSENFTPEPVSC